MWTINFSEEIIIVVGQIRRLLILGLVKSYVWRILNKAIETNVEHAIAITKAVCVLHNLVMKHDQLNNSIDNLEEQTIISKNSGGKQNNRFGRLAKDSRELFTEYFSSQAGSVPCQLDHI